MTQRQYVIVKYNYDFIHFQIEIVRLNVKKGV